jgi:hypothetical protein
MKRTIYLPKNLDRRLIAYVRAHPGATFSSAIQEAVNAFIGRRSPRRILRLTGVVNRASGPAARDRAEDMTIADER